MKFLQLIFAILFLFSIKSSAQYFEGTITYKTTDIPENRFSYLSCDTTEIYTVKDDKIRLESSGQFFDFYVIYSNTKSGDVVSYNIDTIQKYYEILISDCDMSNFKTNKKYKRRKRKDKKILGYTCKHYYYVDNTPPFPARFDYWVTDSIITKISGLGLFIKDRGVVLKSIFKSAGEEIITEAVAISHKPISEELFKIPADCKPRKSKIPEAMKKYKVDEKSIPRDSLQHIKDTTKKIDLGKWSEDNYK